MAIIADDTIEKTSYVTMTDDGMGDLINIPSIFISEKDGDLLKKGVKEDKDEYPVIVVSFNLNKVEHAHYSFFINLPSKSSFVMLREFDEHRKKLGEKAIFKPVYEFYPCYSCKLDDYDTD